jgi:hypothetical protein
MSLIAYIGNVRHCDREHIASESLPTTTNPREAKCATARPDVCW